MKLVHLVTYNEKFIPRQLQLLNAEFGQNDQEFYLIGGGKGLEEVLGANIYRLTKRSLLAFVISAHRANRLVFNGLYSQSILTFLLLFPWLIRKAVWLPWGGDLYWRGLVPATRWNRFLDHLRRRFICQLNAIATPTRGDYLKAQEMYQTRARYIDGCPNIFAFEREDLDQEKARASVLRQTKKAKIIQIGNSGDPSNEHLEVFEWIKEYASENIEIHVPLSYGFAGEEGYRDEVLQRGRELFGEKFKPMTRLLEAAEYNQYLSTVDVMIFNHKRQQGFGNMVISLYLGTKMYLRSSVSTWTFLKDKMGCTVFDTESILGMTYSRFTELESTIRTKNEKAVSHLFDRKWQKQRWEELYRE